MRTLCKLAVLAALLGLASCITPSIPIPPPSPDRMEFEVDITAGTSTFSYPPEDNYSDAVVYVFNRTVGEGIITTANADGSISATPPFPANFGDEVAVTIEAEAQTVGTCVVLRQTGPVPDCSF
jgi:hypothetical protein